MSTWGLGEVGADRGSREARACDLTFGAPLHILSDAFGPREASCVATVDDALAVLASAGPLRFGADGRERAEWAHALECAATAKFDRTADAVETARAALRAYARSVGVLATLRGVGRCEGGLACLEGAGQPAMPG
jgi:hypothetical protein